MVFGISVPFFSAAAGTTVSVQTDASSYPGQPGTHIVVSGTVSPAPGASGYAVGIELNSSQGLLQVFSASVDGTTGAYSYTITTGFATGGWINGTYTIEVKYSAVTGGPIYTATTTYQYGATGSTTPTTTTSSQSATTVTSTVSTTVTTTVPGPTVTSLSTITVPTTQTSTTTTTVTSGTWETIGIIGIVLAVVFAGLAGFTMMRRH